jgi:drug/metabolite transporter (DMT)-like permease
MALLDRVLFGKRLHPLANLGLVAGFFGLAVLVDPFGAGSIDRIGAIHPAADAFGAIAYLIVIGTLVGFTAYVWLLRHAPISLVATYAYVNPIIAVALGATSLGKDLTPQMLAAGGLIVASVALIVRKSGTSLEPGRSLRRRTAPAEASPHP